jgi:hypothetical protein
MDTLIRRTRQAPGISAATDDKNGGSGLQTILSDAKDFLSKLVRNAFLC